MQIPQLLTERLILREFREQDLDVYAQMCGDSEVMRYVGNGRPLSRGESWRSLATMLGHWHLRGYGMWAVEERASSEMMGRIGCWKPEGWPGLEIGWTLRREYWGKGYATEAAKISMDYAFEKLGQSDVISLIRPENEASKRVAQKIGEKLEGMVEIFGTEALIYRISRQEWQSNLTR